MGFGMKRMSDKLVSCTALAFFIATIVSCMVTVEYITLY